MKDTSVAFIVCLFIGLGFSMLLDNSDRTFQTKDGEELGFLVAHQQTEDSLFDAAFDATFHARLNVTSPNEIRTVTSFINIYEEGDHVAKYSFGGLLYDDDFLFYGNYIDFAMGGINNLEENDGGYYWTNVIKASDGSLRSRVDLRNEGDLEMWMTQDLVTVKDAEPVIYGVGVIEGTGEMYSGYENRAEFEEWAESQGKVMTIELLISSEKEELETWDLRQNEK